MCMFELFFYIKEIQKFMVQINYLFCYFTCDLLICQIILDYYLVGFFSFMINRERYLDGLDGVLWYFVFCRKILNYCYVFSYQYYNLK